MSTLNVRLRVMLPCTHGDSFSSCRTHCITRVATPKTPSLAPARPVDNACSSACVTMPTPVLPTSLSALPKSQPTMVTTSTSAVVSASVADSMVESVAGSVALHSTQQAAHTGATTQALRLLWMHTPWRVLDRHDDGSATRVESHQHCAATARRPELPLDRGQDCAKGYVWMAGLPFLHCDHVQLPTSVDAVAGVVHDDYRRHCTLHRTQDVRQCALDHCFRSVHDFKDNRAALRQTRFQSLNILLDKQQLGVSVLFGKAVVAVADQQHKHPTLFQRLWTRKHTL
jgi:hypothetical protein